MKRLSLLLILLNLFPAHSQQRITSPNGKVEVSVHMRGQDLDLSISLNDKLLVESLRTHMVLNKGRRFDGTGLPKEVRKREVKEEIKVIVPTKSAVIEDHFVEMTLEFDQYDLQVRAYDNGVAWRYISRLGGKVEVLDEGLDLTLAEDLICYFPEEKRLISHFENYYQKMRVSEIPEGAIGGLPLLFTNEEGISLSVTEADLYDYPNLFLKRSSQGFESLFPGYVISTEELGPGQDRLEAIKEEAPYIAVTQGDRSFPWRIVMIADGDKELLENQLVYQLSSPLELKDVSWIQPGKVAWDWWNAHNIYGVDFKSGLNTQTYKYYIDFAAEFGLEYIILDEGWSISTLDVSRPNPDIDMEALTAYARDKGVGVILWSLWRPLDQHMDALLEKYEEWGIKGIKVDFIQRADQYVVNFYERLARKAAEHHLLVNFHGGMKPSGMRRAYPNIINYEAVKGLENNKWEMKITPEHDLTLPFTRMTAGIMDYTPGGMDNTHPGNFAIRFNRPMTLGTRAHQIALYMVFEAPLQMLADSPSSYYNNRRSTAFISRVPTTWEETRILRAGIADYVVLARKNKGVWYLGALTDASPRSFRIALDFLDPGKEYRLEYIEDGKNADRIARDFHSGTRKVTADDTLDLSMVGGGGWVGILTEG